MPAGAKPFGKRCGRTCFTRPRKESKSRIERLDDVDHPQYRLRVGEMRVFHDVTGRRVEVLGIVQNMREAIVEASMEFTACAGGRFGGESLCALCGQSGSVPELVIT